MKKIWNMLNNMNILTHNIFIYLSEICYSPSNNVRVCRQARLRRVKSRGAGGSTIENIYIKQYNRIITTSIISNRYFIRSDLAWRQTRTLCNLEVQRDIWPLRDYERVMQSLEEPDAQKVRRKSVGRSWSSQGDLIASISQSLLDGIGWTIGGEGDIVNWVELEV